MLKFGMAGVRINKKMNDLISEIQKIYDRCWGFTAKFELHLVLIRLNWRNSTYEQYEHDDYGTWLVYYNTKNDVITISSDQEKLTVSPTQIQEAKINRMKRTEEIFSYRGDLF